MNEYYVTYYTTSHRFYSGRCHTENDICYTVYKSNKKNISKELMMEIISHLGQLATILNVIKLEPDQE